jgi:hypothetical protein
MSVQLTRKQKDIINMSYNAFTLNSTSSVLLKRYKTGSYRYDVRICTKPGLKIYFSVTRWDVYTGSPKLMYETIISQYSATGIVNTSTHKIPKSLTELLNQTILNLYALGYK